ncbi:MAG TPA: dTDP-glucose 4,6-dehydratase [Acidobacteriota bacterium]|nr:dTDP-glucose 4,6-dehydratase [Acidobacteriota bacterium]
MRILVTGGAGFIGSNFVRHILSQRPGWQIVNLDALTYAGNLGNLADVSEDSRYRFVKGDITDADAVEACMDPVPDAVLNFAAESHVDRSIEDASSFVRTNVTGTQVLLEAARRHKVGRFLQVSTDEVYGSLGPQGAFREDSPLRPNSPYAASKAAADLLVRSYHETFKLDTVVTRCSNNYGPYQFPEKLIPLMLLNALQNKPLPVYGDGLYTRDWIHVEDHCRALHLALLKGRSGAVYNIGANREEKNIDIVKRILTEVGKPESLIKFVKDRPGHDRRYAIDAGFTRKSLGWRPRIDFEEGLRQTVAWYSSHRDWVDQVRSGEYQNYYKRMYEERDQTLSALE